jgi:hypothetical protein
MLSAYYCESQIFISSRTASIESAWITKRGILKMNTEILFEPLEIADLALPNRVMMTTIKLDYGTEKGEVTDRHIAFYVQRAEGGAGLITTEPLFIHRNG